MRDKLRSISERLSKFIAYENYEQFCVINFFFFLCVVGDNKEKVFAYF